jgi:enamine deaminase RidA (YjgF/YER057c/UK114 family)
MQPKPTEGDSVTGTVEMISGEGLVPPAGLYSHAAVVESPSRLIAVAGQLAVDETGSPVGVGDFAVQFRTVFTNLGAVLEAADSGWNQVLKFTTFLTDADDVGAFYQERERLFAELYPNRSYPPNTLLVVAHLVRPEFLLEVEALAVGRTD